MWTEVRRGRSFPHVGVVVCWSQVSLPRACEPCSGTGAQLSGAQCPGWIQSGSHIAPGTPVVLSGHAG